MTLNPGQLGTDHPRAAQDTAERQDEVRRQPLLALTGAASIVRANLKLIAGILTAALTLGGMTTLLTPNRYTATAAIQINDHSQPVLGNQAEVDQITQKGTDTERFLQTQLGLLQSRALAGRVAEQLDLDRNARFRQQIGGQKPDPIVPDALAQETTINLLRNNLQVKLPRNSRIATIAFTSEDPLLSAQIANTFADEFIQSALRQRQASSAYARDFVADQLQEARHKLEQAERKLNAYSRQAGLIRSRQPGSPATGSPDSSLTASSLEHMNSAAAAAHAERIAAEARLKSWQSTSLLANREVLQNPAIQTLLKRRAELAAQLESQLTRQLDSHPAVLQLRAELRVIERQLEQEARTMRRAAQADLQAAIASETQLRTEVEALKAAALLEQEQAVEFGLLSREVETNRALYDGLLERFQQLNASTGIATSNIVIIDRAAPPQQPSSPNAAKNLAIALLGGLVLAFAVLLLRHHRDGVIRR